MVDTQGVSISAIVNSDDAAQSGRSIAVSVAVVLVAIVNPVSLLYVASSYSESGGLHHSRNS